MEGGAHFNSAEHNQYYQGVSSREALSGSQASRIEDEIMPFAGIELLVPVSDNSAVVGLLDDNDLRQVEESPLLDVDYQAAAHLGFIHSF